MTDQSRDAFVPRVTDGRVEEEIGCGSAAAHVADVAAGAFPGKPHNHVVACSGWGGEGAGLQRQRRVDRGVEKPFQRGVFDLVLADPLQPSRIAASLFGGMLLEQGKDFFGVSLGFDLFEGMDESLVGTDEVSGAFYPFD